MYNCQKHLIVNFCLKNPDVGYTGFVVIAVVVVVDVVVLITKFKC